MKSRSQKAALNIYVMAIYEAVSFCCGLILPRLILTTFGSEYNGVISSITQFLNFMTMLRMGIAGPTRVVLYKALADNDFKKVSGVVNATENYMRKVGLFLIGYIAVLSVIYPLISTTSIPRFDIALLVVILGIGSFAEYFWGNTYYVLLNADQAQYIYYLIQAVSTVLSTIAGCILIIAGANIFTVKGCSACFFLITPFVLRVFVRKRYKIDRKVSPDRSGLDGRWNAMGHSIANIIYSYTDVTVLTFFLDIKIVSVYIVYNLVFNAIKKVLAVFTTGLEGGFGNMLAKNEIEAADRNFSIYEFAMYLFCSIAFSCTYILIVPFVSLYTKGVTDVNYIVPLFAALSTITQMFVGIRQPYLTIVQAAGHYKQTRNGAFLEAALNVVISLALTFKFGLVGVTIGTLVATLFRTIQYILYIGKNILRRKITIAFRLILWLFFNLAVIILSGSVFLQFISVDSWIEWVMSAVIVFAFAVIITCGSALLFYRGIFINSVLYLKKMVKRR